MLSLMPLHALTRIARDSHVATPVSGALVPVAGISRSSSSPLEHHPKDDPALPDETSSLNDLEQIDCRDVVLKLD